MPLKPKPKSIAKIAEQIIKGPRRKSYGAIEKSGVELATLMNLILSDELKKPIKPPKAMLVMVGLKLLREKNRPKKDNRIDIIGYTLLSDKLT